MNAAEDALDVKRAELSSGDVLELIAELDAELIEIYPEEGATHFRLESDEVSETRGAFLVASLGGTAVGCGAVRLIDSETAEIKRMYTSAKMRGRGIARRILDELEAHARKLGAKRIVLETGERQPYALALYGRAGFVRIPLFGEYIGSPLSVCMGKTL
jgi:GNAT superfamily N-acetyltransferase